MRKTRNPFDYLFLLRPTLLIPVWTFLLLGYYRALEEPRIHLLAGPQFLLAFLLYSALMGGVYILNQIVDRETDRANRKLFLVSEGYVPVKLASLEMILLFVVALALAFRFSFSFFVFVVISLGLGVAYSAPPLKLKGRPIWDLLSNSLGYGLVNFGAGWLAVRSLSGEMFLRSIPYVLSVGAVFVNTTIPDIPGDQEAGDRTTGIFLGMKRSLLLSTSLLSLALVSSLLLRDWVCLTASVWSLPLFIRAAVRSDLKSCLQSMRLGAASLVVLAAILFPLYLVLLLVALASMRVYYRYRFGIRYPSLGEDRHRLSPGELP